MLYKIWIDCIKRVSLKEKNEGKSIRSAILIISFLMAFNFFTIMMLVQNSLGVFFYRIGIQYFSDFINYILTLVLLYFTPILFVNLFYVNNNLVKLRLGVKKEEAKVNYILNYTLATIFIPLILFWVTWIWCLF